MAAERFTKVILFVTRHPEISEEEFHQHWSEFHGPLASPFLLRHGVVKYAQFHSPSIKKTESASVFGNDHNPLSRYDAAAEFVVKDFEVFKKAFLDPEWSEKLKPDEDYLFDRSKTMIFFAGYEEVYIENNQLTELAIAGKVN